MAKKKPENCLAAQEEDRSSADDVQPDSQETQGRAPDEAQVTEGGERTFPIVGIGASAGGLAAFEKFFANMPATTESGMAFVLVQHLAPDHKSMLAELVRRYTEMQVFEITDGITVLPNCTYIIPPNKGMALLHGKLQLMEPVGPRGRHLPIDYFFRSLAQDQHERAIGIVLSGTGSDGVLGLKEIKGQGGMAMVQEPESADFDGMPCSAIATGMVDFILPPEQMPAQLIAYVAQAFARRFPAAFPPTAVTADALQKVFVLIRNQTGHDFTYYKRNTIQRRIERRMAVNQINGLETYVRYLQQNPLEVDVLFRELLIGVTSFFRDPEAFETLQQQAIIPLLARQNPTHGLRIWAPGCATGEEAFSIAMLVHEGMETLGQHFKVQIFATDIDAAAIDRARAGIYPASIAGDVSPERLALFFQQEDDNYRVHKSLRDMVVFATQNVIDDPPFSKLDLVSCRNMLIYLGPEVQRKVAHLFHYALKTHAFLLLGSSETMSEHLDLFGVVDRKWKLFRRKEGPSPRLAAGFALPILAERPASLPVAAQIRPGRDKSMRELVEQALLEQHTPPCVVINQRGELLYIHGRTGRYLEPSAGDASLSIIRMARAGLRPALAKAIRTAFAQNGPVLSPGLHVKTNGDVAIVDLLVTPMRIPGDKSGLMMILFHDVTAMAGAAPEAGGAKRAPISDKDQQIADLEREMLGQEEYLQTAIEELEATKEELQSTNEEQQSINEELQSTNEELQTAKEELQSTNEELVTVNYELQMKLNELSQANNDLNNLLASTDVGILFVDNRLNIKRFTPSAAAILNLIATDIGRPVAHIASNLDYAHLVRDIKAVLDTLVSREVEVQTTDGRWRLIRILPYRTVTNVIDGAVITIFDTTEMKRLQGLSRLAVVVRDANDAITMYDFEGAIMAWNPRAVALYGWTETEALAMNIYDTVPANKHAEMLAFTEQLARGQEIRSFETQRVTKAGEVLDVWLTVSTLTNTAGKPYAIATTERLILNEP